MHKNSYLKYAIFRQVVGERLYFFKNEYCKNSIWNVYNKAYKQHYARYFKKKMTHTEFQQWTDYALELRAKAENGEIEFEEYRGD